MKVRPGLVHQRQVDIHAALCNTSRPLGKSSLRALAQAFQPLASCVTKLLSIASASGQSCLGGRAGSEGKLWARATSSSVHHGEHRVSSDRDPPHDCARSNLLLRLELECLTWLVDFWRSDPAWCTSAKLTFMQHCATQVDH